MKKFLNIFFVTLGVIFFIILLIAAYLWVADPYNLKPLIFGGESSEYVGDGIDKNPMLSESQESMLESAGIDPASVPSQITPAQEQCFIEKLGASRVEEIKAGATPSPLEIMRAKDCI